MQHLHWIVVMQCLLQFIKCIYKSTCSLLLILTSWKQNLSLNHILKVKDDTALGWDVPATQVSWWTALTCSTSSQPMLELGQHGLKVFFFCALSFNWMLWPWLERPNDRVCWADNDQMRWWLCWNETAASSNRFILIKMWIFIAPLKQSSQ